MRDFEDKVVVVTGAARGIGEAVAKAFADRGARIAANDLSRDNLAQTIEAITAAGGVARAFAGDVADRMSVSRIADQVLGVFGRIDVLVNNAGVEPHASLLQLTEADWDRTLGVNLKGPFLLMQSVGRLMVEQGQGGAIVNIASIAGRAHGLKDRSAYVASKMGLIGLTREAARELAEYHIRVNAVCPGVIETEMTATLRRNEAVLTRWLADIPQGRLGLPEDVTSLVLFLCTDGAAYITGQAINVDGGKVMS